MTKKRAEIEEQELDEENAPLKHPVAAINYINNRDTEFSPLTKNSFFLLQTLLLPLRAALTASSEKQEFQG